MKSMTWVIAIFASAVALQACTKQGVDPAKVQADVAKAQAEGQEKIAAAQAKVDRLKNELNSVPAAPGSPAPTTGTPPSGVDAPGTTAIAIDPAQRLADAQFDLDKAKAEQSYNVAIARCEDRVDDANKACRDLAKSLYDSAIDQAKAKTKTPAPPSGKSGE